MYRLITTILFLLLFANESWSQSKLISVIDSFKYTNEYGYLTGHYTPNKIENGTVITYFDSRLKRIHCIHSFKDSLLHGSVFYFFQNGTLWAHALYYKGEQQWRNVYHTNGQPMLEVRLENDSISERSWNPKGKEIPKEELMKYWYKQLKKK